MRFVALVDEPFHDPCNILVGAVSSGNEIDVLHTYNFIGETLESRRARAVKHFVSLSSPQPPELVVFFDANRFALLHKPEKRTVLHLLRLSLWTGRILSPAFGLDIWNSDIFAGAQGVFQHYCEGVHNGKAMQPKSPPAITSELLSTTARKLTDAENMADVFTKSLVLELNETSEYSKRQYSFFTTGSRKEAFLHSAVKLKDDPHWFFHTCGDVSQNLLYDISTYWINLRSSNKRKKLMEEQFARINSKRSRTRFTHSRIEAVTYLEAKKKVEEGSVVVSRGMQVGEDSFLGKSYSFRELGCVLSHLKALIAVEQAGDPFALVLEDDVLLDPEFFTSLPDILSDAPQDWDIIQLYSLSADLSTRFRALKYTNFVHWFPRHWSTSGYIVRRSAISKILGKVYSCGAGCLNLTKTFVADELLYHDMRSYTCTLPSIKINKDVSASTIQHVGVDPSKPNEAYGDIQRKAFEWFAPPASTMVFTTARLSSLTDTNETLRLMVSNMLTLRTHGFSPLWITHFAVPDQALIPQLRKRVSLELANNFLFNTEVHFDVVHGRYNKFFFLSTHLSKMRDVDNFLMFDADFDLTGFAWKETMDVLKIATVVGSVHENVEEQLGMNWNKPTRQHFKIFDGRWWSEHLAGVTAIEVPFIEQGFALMDARFAFWFFSQILQKKYLVRRKWLSTEANPSDFGPDLLWCGAAREWLLDKNLYRHKPCVLTAFSSILHTDSRQISAASLMTRDKPTSLSLATMERFPLRRYQKDFSRWNAFSENFIQVFGGVWDVGSDTLDKLRRSSVDTWTYQAKPVVW